MIYLSFKWKFLFENLGRFILGKLNMVVNFKYSNYYKVIVLIENMFDV